MDYILKIMNIEELSRDMRKFVVVRPAGFTFEPGKSVMVAINKRGYEDEKKLCTFLSLNGEYYIEIIFKNNIANPDNSQFFNAKAGEEIIMSDVVGNTEFVGNGAFISAGKGIVPYLNIFLHLKKMDVLATNKIIYFALDDEDVLFPRLLNIVFKNNVTIILGRDMENSARVKKIDEQLLKQKLPTLEGKKFYISGPEYFVENAKNVLQQLNITPQTEIIE